MKKALYQHQGVMHLERGGRLVSPTIAYQMWGKPKEDGSNVVWVCHALTANADVYDWWPGLFGPDYYFNHNDWCIICANVLGSCYGSTGPLSINPETGKPYYGDFPDVTIRDMVQAHRLLADHLNIGHIEVIIGGSLGGQQLLEWAVQDGDRFGRLIAMATNVIHSPWGIAFNESQRMAIEADGSWGAPRPDAGIAGMRAARAAALLSYRTYHAYGRSQQPQEGDAPFHRRAVSYQRYQGEKLARRFNAYSYYTLSKAMDSHDLGRGRESLEAAVKSIKAKALVIGIESDILFPPQEQVSITESIPGAELVLLDSDYGHDGFLVETAKLVPPIAAFIAKTQRVLSGG